MADVNRAVFNFTLWTLLHTLVAATAFCVAKGVTDGAQDRRERARFQVPEGQRVRCYFEDDPSVVKKAPMVLPPMILNAPPPDGTDL